jgi:hypothetical protein
VTHCTSYGDETYLVPTADTVILTDPVRTAAVFASAGRSPLPGAMLTRGATNLLYHSWFGESLRSVASAMRDACGDQAQDITFASAAALWIGEQPGLSLQSKPTAAQRLGVEAVEKPKILALPGLNRITLQAGRLLTRQIAGRVVHYHEAAEHLPSGTVPRENLPYSVTLSVGDDVFPRLLPKQMTSAAGSSCAACAGCGLCAFCTLCGEVNFAVGVVGATGLVGLVGLAGSFPINGEFVR